VWGPNEIRYLINLKYLNLSNNKINSIPNSIIYCTHLTEFEFNNNISPIVIRFLKRLNNNYDIKESLFNSIVNIINQNYTYNIYDIINNIMEDYIISDKTKKLLIVLILINSLDIN
jgi:Leucine-rich repeat (LRR) protein